MLGSGRPGEPATVIRLNPKTGERNMDELVWGLLPHDTVDSGSAPRPIHARAETVQELPMFADAFRRRRAIVPADQYAQKGTIGEQEGRHFRVSRVDGAPMAMAGLWESYVWPDGRIERTFCVITIAANELMARIHDRMSVVLERDDWPLWLGEAPGDPVTLLRASAPGVLRLDQVGHGKRGGRRV
ncbi:MAG TPA: SOS response-associated peptidase [Rhizomicrobium sp.]|nr:SOS response-associated peptidase [Rhizomicrobium sp.]